MRIRKKNPHKDVANKLQFVVLKLKV
jgi:hypothetical protein